LLIDTQAGEVAEIDARLLDNTPCAGDPTITQMIRAWHDRADSSLWETIGYAGAKIDSESLEMAKLLTIPWLEAFPEAQIGLFSPRYVQSLPKGDISPASILGMIPVDNELVDLQLTGTQVLETLRAHNPAFGGLIETEGIYTLADGSPLELDASYHVLIPDALYEGGNYYAVKQFDPDGAYTGVSWRTPVEEWVGRQNTSRQHPLDSQLKVLSPEMEAIR
jgi:2',3'-cyclic-nucleotide 2'-phosphodiesterase (5'-nucleotidase family)